MKILQDLGKAELIDIIVYLRSVKDYQERRIAELEKISSESSWKDEERRVEQERERLAGWEHMGG